VGSENLFKKRKALNTSQLGRKYAIKTSKETVLIVCEGSKTEPLYLDSLLRHFGLQQRVDRKEIAVDDRKTGLDPSRLVQRAIELFDAEQTKGFTYDRVYCVFDKDCHTKYESACQTINNQPLKKRRSKMYSITSVPCFEIWLLFHYTDSSAPFHASDSRSVCDQVIVKLKKSDPSFANYEKGDVNTFEYTINKIGTARINAERIWDQIAANGENPSTKIFQLVDDLEEIAEPENT